MKRMCVLTLLMQPSVVTTVMSYYKGQRRQREARSLAGDSRAHVPVQAWLRTSGITSSLLRLFHIKNDTDFAPPNTMLITCQCWSWSPRWGPKTPLTPPSGLRGFKTVSFWVGMASVGGVGCHWPWIPPRNRAWKTGKRCSWQQMRVNMKSILSCQLTPLLQRNKCIAVEFAATGMPVMVQNPFCLSLNSASQDWHGRIF